MGKKTPPHKAYPAWTRAKYFGWLRAGLRRMWLKWPPRYEKLNEQRYRNPLRPSRNTWLYRCEECGEGFANKQVQVDHTEPVGTLQKHSDLGAFVGKLFCEKDGLQVLCKTCHATKTKLERDRKKEKVNENLGA